MSPRRRAYLAWIAVCLIWGTTYLGIRIALETIPPFLMAAFRWIVAGSLISAILGRPRRARRPPPRLRQRRRRVGRTDRLERPDRRARFDGAVLDGRHRGADTGRRSADAAPCGWAARWLRRHCDTGVARDSHGWKRTAVSGRSRRRAARVRGMGRRVDVRATPRAPGERPRHRGVRDAVRR